MGKGGAAVLMTVREAFCEFCIREGGFEVCSRGRSEGGVDGWGTYVFLPEK